MDRKLTTSNKVNTTCNNALADSNALNLMMEKVNCRIGWSIAKHMWLTECMTTEMFKCCCVEGHCQRMHYRGLTAFLPRIDDWLPCRNEWQVCLAEMNDKLNSRNAWQCVLFSCRRIVK